MRIFIRTLDQSKKNFATFLQNKLFRACLTLQLILIKVYQAIDTRIRKSFSGGSNALAIEIYSELGKYPIFDHSDSYKTPDNLRVTRDHLHAGAPEYVKYWVCYWIPGAVPSFDLKILGVLNAIISPILRNIGGAIVHTVPAPMSCACPL